MTSGLEQDFANRKRQVRHYLTVVMQAERLSRPGGVKQNQEGRLLTLRAGMFLVLYNLIEASIRGAIRSIHDQIVTEQVPFDALSVCLRKEMIRRFKIHADPSLHQNVANFPSAFVNIALLKGIELSGNVDARRIREISETYGFSETTDSSLTWGGSDLLTIKSQRNDLAHGDATFEEVGRNYPVEDLYGITRRSLIYMRNILDNVNKYLKEKHYLDLPPP